MIIKILASHLKELLFMVMESIGLILSKLSALKFEEVLIKDFKNLIYNVYKVKKY